MLTGGSRLAANNLTSLRDFSARKTPDEKTRLGRQIEATDGQIDGLVYELYGLTGEEIKTVERAGGN